MGKSAESRFCIFKTYGWSGDLLHVLGDESHDDWWGRYCKEQFKAEFESIKINVTDREVIESFGANDRPGLFLEFANLKLSQRMIRHFVSQHGLLGCGKSATSDTFWDYVREVNEIRRTIIGWLMVTTKIEPAEDAKMEASLFPIMQRRINRRLAGIKIIIDEQLKLSPLSDRLIDLIWLQLSKAIDAGHQLGRCHRCGKFFEVSGGAGRTDKMYCGNTCKIGAYRERKRAAVELRAEGTSLRDIARQLGSDVSTVKGWLQQKGE